MLGAGSAEHDLAEEFSLQQTDDLLVFANNNDDDDDENEGIVGGEEGNGIDGRWLSGPCDLKGFGFSGNDSYDGGGEYLNLSCDDIAHLEWLSNFMEDSFSANMGIANHLTSSSSNNKNYSIKDSQFTSSSPDSVLESSISSSGKSLLLGPNTIVPGRARSKRPRPASFSPRPLPLISPTSSETSDPALLLSPDSPLPSESEDFTESKLPKKSFKKKKLQQHVDQAASQHVVVRKCMHCGIQKTPQWRAGPMGPKTLCNACGVRYKSGRLFPEYRPAASPTFIPSLHSNSHKKVLEMRVVKSGEKKPAPEPEFVRKTNHLLECI